ncbi:hypothetical protein Z517_00879 [Fonsecaea pedrosoi CBS 271.37]|uniref:Actin-like ATPase domain-containing protein n=1 Tax=Fonsecaea pedrosoi CBS 271.37 TaxID=1442368 RepID=A0A0D2GWX8_9EURO|nr:uncharacterized protein Z517_00879 [Fonsecaea pedrosoi CBS 271.37]KAH0844994.1 hypothetical protein FOPE_09373 [Fonsecaea pedrosoi]KIW85488.1 hypothetical protein Z517_00879 [Fonsecaea pedrosoi CBS 271.37]
MAGNAQPELVIGVDFGMSQTGVAYCTAPWTNPSTFQSWTTIASELFNKAPSRLAYDHGTANIKSWGFFADVADKTVDIKEYFKLHLDPEYGEWKLLSHQDARRYYLDYMRCVHDHIARYFQTRYAQWATMRVEWNFSVPTTWKHAGMVRDLLEILKLAGFGRDGPYHSSVVTLTEAEAAAVCVAKQMLKRDDVILVCDAGGGTTDVNIMKVKSEMGETLRLEQLLQVEGREVGSALIDIKVQQHLASRLALVPEILHPPETAERMMLGRFERFKCSFGSPGMTAPKLFLPVVGLPAGLDYPQAGIRDSHMEIDQDTIQHLFDEQVDGLLELIEEQLHALKRNRPGEQVSYLIMSGGLSASEYIQRRVKTHFESGAGAEIPNIRGLRMLLAENLQLAVVQGLVSYRAQEISKGRPPIEQRCAPVSYGVVVNQKYSQQRHFGQRVVRDKRDGQRWAVDQIEWLIRKGDKVTDNGLEKMFKAKLSPAQYRKPWQAQFVVSTRPIDALPQSMAEKDHVRTLCTVTVDLKLVDRHVRNKHWWNFGERYELAHFRLRLIPGSFDLKFRLLSGGRLVNSEDDQVKVDWSGGGSHRQSTTSNDDLDQWHTMS